MDIKNMDLLLVEESIWILTRPIGMAVYDFAFDRFFACRRPCSTQTANHGVGESLGLPRCLFSRFAMAGMLTKGKGVLLNLVG